MKNEPKFSLIRTLNEKENPRQCDAPKIALKYQTYDIQLNNNTNLTSVLIPLKECDNFETKLSNLDFIDESILKQLLREFRGLRNNKKEE